METAKLQVAGFRLPVEVRGQGGHGEAVFEGGDGAFGLEGLVADRGEEDAIEGEGVGGGGGQAEVAAMDGVECAAEEGYAHSDYATARTRFKVQGSRLRGEPGLKPG